MSNRTLTTLDFIITVLREHESELSILSNKLEESISQIPIKNVLNNLNDIHESLNRQEQKALTTSSLETSIKQLVNLTIIQNQKLNSLIKIISTYPKKE